MSPRVIGMLIALAVFIASPGVAQDRSAADGVAEDNTLNKEQRTRWLGIYRDEAAAYEMFRSDSREGSASQAELLQLQPAPILTFTNPVRVRDTHGAAFVWTNDGRPEVIGAIWSVISPVDSNQRRLSHEFHSLSLVGIDTKHEPRVSRRGAVPDWTTTEAGVTPAEIPNAPVPAQTERMRLTQMRQFARGFEAKIPTGLSDGQGSLRLLAQPLYRYQSKRHHVIDGAVFAFVMGTDPELVLLIEAIDQDAGPQWRFAAARLANLPLILEYKREKVWECGRAMPYVGDQPHFLYWGVSARDRLVE